MRRTAALIVLSAIIVSALAGCVVTQQNASDHTSATIAPTASSGAVTTSSTAAARPMHYRVSAGTATVDAEAADTPLKQEIGLMNRTGLGPNAGMLFLLPYAEPQGMWMKNMQFPIDIVFITEDLHVLQVYTEVPPCVAEPCPTYVSDAPVLYVLEVNAGFCARHEIVSGAPVIIAPG
ncbi:MAG: DUF192 domain-containing protein [Halobacteriota archaeon]